MAKKAYIGVDNVARKIKKGYIGVEGVARKIRKAYIGIGGVARPFWGNGELAYYGTTPVGLGHERLWPQGASNDKYAIFASGVASHQPVYCSGVDAFDKSLTRYAAANSSAVYDHRGTRVGDYAIFAGGIANGSSTTANAYDSSLTHKTTSIPYEDTCSPGFETTKNNKYAIFMGGGYSRKSVFAFDASLTRIPCTDLANWRYHIPTALIGEYTIFAGGQIIGYAVDIVDVYNEQLTKFEVANLDLNPAHLQHVSVDSYYDPERTVGSSTDVNAIFVSKYEINTYSKSLTKTSFISQSIPDYFYSCATSLGGFAVFGRNTGMDVYDGSLTKTSIDSISSVRNYMGAASIGNFALFAGGGEYGDEAYKYYNHTSTVDVVTLL